MLDTPNALFLSPDGTVLPDSLICSGRLAAELDGQPCPYAVQGRMPGLEPLREDTDTYSVDKGRPGDLCPTCAKHQLGSLRHWQGHHGQQFPEELLSLRLFKCRQWFWLVVPGLHDACPAELAAGDCQATEC